MNSTIEQISNFLAILLGFNIVANILQFFSIDNQTINVISLIYYLGAIFLLIMTIYFFFIEKKQIKEINKIKKQNAEKEAKGDFLYSKDFTIKKDDENNKSI